MKRLVGIVLATLLLSGPLTAAPPNLDSARDPGEISPPRPHAATVTIPSNPPSLGDDIASAFVIGSLPFTDQGNTCDYLDDYDEVCPYGGSLAPDVVYAYTPLQEQTVNIFLCDSDYDTKLYVYENGLPTLHGWNDDACGSDGYRSELLDVPLYAGNTYYIVVDGYGNYCGEYDLRVEDSLIHGVECPTGSIAEGEPDCGDDYDDQFNSGCGSASGAAFSSLSGTPGGTGFTVCGTGGTFVREGLFYRDTDWYELVVTEPNTISIECGAEFPVQIVFLDGSEGCANMEILASATAGIWPDVVTISQPCDPGTYWFWVGADSFQGVPCGSEYTFLVWGYTASTISVETTTWGGIKSLYR